MQYVVTRVEPDHVLDALRATLRMHADAPEIIAGSAFQQPQVRPPQHLEISQRLPGIDDIVPKSLGPQILVIPGERRPVVRQNHSEPEAPDKLGIGEMLKHVADRPLRRRLGLRQLTRRQSLDGAFEGILGFLEHLEGIPGAEEAQHGGGIRRRLLRRP